MIQENGEGESLASAKVCYYHLFQTAANCLAFTTHVVHSISRNFDDGALADLTFLFIKWTIYIYFVNIFHVLLLGGLIHENMFCSHFI